MNVEISLLAVLIGLVAGLRSMTAPAVVSWAARLGWLHLRNTGLAFLSSPITVGLFTLAALGELVADKLPGMGKRTAPGPLVVRMIAGGLGGSALCLASEQEWMFGAAAGAIGAVLGSYGGYFARTGLVRGMGIADIFVAIPEDLLTIALGLLAVSRF